MKLVLTLDVETDKSYEDFTQRVKEAIEIKDSSIIDEVLDHLKGEIKVEVKNEG